MTGSPPAAVHLTQAEVQLDRLLALPLTGADEVDASEEQDLASFYSRSRKGKQRAVEQTSIADEHASDAGVAAQLAMGAERDERETRAIALFCELWEGRGADETATSVELDAAAQPAHTGLLIDFDASDGEDAEGPAKNTLLDCWTTSAAREPEAPEPPALSLAHARARASTDSEDQAARPEGCNGEVEEGREGRSSLSSATLAPNRDITYQAGSGRLSTPASNDTEQLPSDRSSRADPLDGSRDLDVQTSLREKTMGLPTISTQPPSFRPLQYARKSSQAKGAASSSSSAVRKSFRAYQHSSSSTARGSGNREPVARSVSHDEKESEPDYSPGSSDGMPASHARLNDKKYSNGTRGASPLSTPASLQHAEAGQPPVSTAAFSRFVWPEDTPESAIDEGNADDYAYRYETESDASGETAIRTDVVVSSRKATETAEQGARQWGAAPERSSSAGSDASSRAVSATSAGRDQERRQHVADENTYTKREEEQPSLIRPVLQGGRDLGSIGDETPVLDSAFTEAGDGSKSSFSSEAFVNSMRASSRHEAKADEPTLLDGGGKENEERGEEGGRKVALMEGLGNLEWGSAHVAAPALEEARGGGESRREETEGAGKGWRQSTVLVDAGQPRTAHAAARGPEENDVSGSSDMSLSSGPSVSATNAMRAVPASHNPAHGSNVHRDHHTKPSARDITQRLDSSIAAIQKVLDSLDLSLNIKPISPSKVEAAQVAELTETASEAAPTEWMPAAEAAYSTTELPVASLNEIGQHPPAPNGKGQPAGRSIESYPVMVPSVSPTSPKTILSSPVPPTLSASSRSSPTDIPSSLVHPQPRQWRSFQTAKMLEASVSTGGTQRKREEDEEYRAPTPEPLPGIVDPAYEMEFEEAPVDISARVPATAVTKGKKETLAEDRLSDPEPTAEKAHKPLGEMRIVGAAARAEKQQQEAEQREVEALAQSRGNGTKGSLPDPASSGRGHTSTDDDRRGEDIKPFHHGPGIALRARTLEDICIASYEPSVWLKSDRSFVDASAPSRHLGFSSRSPSPVLNDTIYPSTSPPASASSRTPSPPSKLAQLKAESWIYTTAPGPRWGGSLNKKGPNQAARRAGLGQATMSLRTNGGAAPVRQWKSFKSNNSDAQASEDGGPARMDYSRADTLTRDPAANAERVWKETRERRGMHGGDAERERQASIEREKDYEDRYGAVALASFVDRPKPAAPEWTIESSTPSDITSSRIRETMAGTARSRQNTGGSGTWVPAGQRNGVTPLGSIMAHHTPSPAVQSLSHDELDFFDQIMADSFPHADSAMASSRAPRPAQTAASEDELDDFDKLLNA